LDDVDAAHRRGHVGEVLEVDDDGVVDAEVAEALDHVRELLRAAVGERRVDLGPAQVGYVDERVTWDRDELRRLPVP
jgi:hypothetical protein